MDIPIKPKTVHSLNFIHNSHVDIPPLIIEYQDYKTENILEDIEATIPFYEIQDDEIPLNRKRKTMQSVDSLNEESISNKESFSNTESISNIKHETTENEIETKKKNRKEIDFNELKFEVEYLNLEEQLKEVELKKLKYQDSRFQCDECGLGFLTGDIFDEHKVRHSEVRYSYFDNVRGIPQGGPMIC